MQPTKKNRTRKIAIKNAISEAKNKRIKDAIKKIENRSIHPAVNGISREKQ